MAFFIGDQVKFLNSIEQGIIVKILSSDIVLVDVDGFEQEVSTAEIVHLSHQTKHSNVIQNHSDRNFNPGIYLALLDTGSHIDFAIVNLQNQELLFSVLKPSKPMPYGVLAAQLSSFEYKIFSRLSIGELPDAAQWIFHLMSFRAEMFENHKPWTSEFQLKNKHFNDAPSMLPVLEKSGWMIPMKQLHVAEVKNAEEPKVEEESPKIVIPKIPNSVIDLHIEKLRKDYKKMQSHEILPYQLSIFEENLEAAIQYQMSQITFIHGSGSGVLKACIQEIVKNHSKVQNTQPGDLQRYGLGAITIFFK